MEFSARYLGLIDYLECLKIQEQSVKEVAGGGSAIVVGCQHPTVITLGKRGKMDIDVLDPICPIVTVDRGGHATMHSPGQLVIYPIFPIQRVGISVREFVEILIETTQVTLKEFGMATRLGSGEPGLYSNGGKVAFFGIRVVRGVSMHGLSINVSNDLALFASIRSCGVEEESFDQLGKTDTDIEIDSVFKVWCKAFKAAQ